MLSHQQPSLSCIFLAEFCENDNLRSFETYNGLFSHYLPSYICFALEVFNDNALYKFRFDIDIDIDICYFLYKLLNFIW